mmetsp:Transcript_26373/g.57782  ORF Transcript_26373/g.57782 Transcript_26373/m.57782 type:complete len:835 (+) Transcript_26373:192-2696(+)
MVKITREHSTRGPHTRKGSGKSLLVSSFTLRNTIAFLVAIQGLRVLLSGSNVIERSQQHAQHPIKRLGLEQNLADSISGGGVRGTNNGSINNHNDNKQKQHQKKAAADDIVIEHEGGFTLTPGDDPHKEVENEALHQEPEQGGGTTIEPQKDGEELNANANGKDPQEGGEGDDEDSKDPEEVAGNAAHPKSMGEGLNPIVVDKKGTGPMSVGYVKDFVEERKNPIFRNLETPATDYSSTVAKLVNEKSVIPCQDDSTSTTSSNTGKTNLKCLDSDTPLIAYNSETFPRTWCGQEIKPNAAVIMTEHCTDPIAHLFPTVVPPVTGEHMPPIVIKSTLNKELQDEDVEKIECNIPCQKEKGFEIIHGVDSFIDGETWKITTFENDRSNVRLERSEFKNDHFYSTQSLWSSIPLSTFVEEQNTLRNRPAVDFNSVKEKAIYLVDDDCSAKETKRNRWFEAVQEKTPVDSYAHCGHNTEVPEGMTIATPEGRIALMKQYRIVLALEKTKAKDHITNFVWEALASGAVPVILGAENISDRLPPKSFINANRFQTYGELGDYVKQVVADEELWQSYHQWRDDEAAIEAVEKQYGFTTAGSTCRMCRWAYAKKYGLGWDHTKQQVRSIPKVPKEDFCATADHALVSKPFSELWVTKKHEDKSVLEEDSEGESCDSLETEGDIVVGPFKGHRKVYQHDGVTDFVITEWGAESQDAETVLRLKFPGMRNPDGACFYNTHTLVSSEKGSKISSASIQDDLVKVTILADWDTTIKSSGEGIMEVSVGSAESSSTKDDGSAPRRVRVIIEEMSKVHDKMTEFYPSSYCKRMTKDFIDPIGVYFVDS